MPLRLRNVFSVLGSLVTNGDGYPILILFCPLVDSSVKIVPESKVTIYTLEKYVVGSLGPISPQAALD